MALMAAAGVFHLWQLDTATNLLAGRGAEIISQMAEEKIADISAAVAMQCKLYLLSHPGLEKENFNRDLGFKSLAVQKVGSTGYTALYQRPGADGIWRTWAHVNPKIIAIDMSTLKKTLKDSFADFWRVFTGVSGGRTSRGYYTWQDNDKKFRRKFMVCTPIAGTRFVIAATSYQDELTGSARMLEAAAEAFNDNAKMNTLGILGAILLLIGLIALIYSHRLTAKIKALTEYAQLITAGKPGRKIKKPSRDELGDLAEAIASLRRHQ
jgi:HAMP domain-containing protein